MEWAQLHLTKELSCAQPKITMHISTILSSFESNALNDLTNKKKEKEEGKKIEQRTFLSENKT